MNFGGLCISNNLFGIIEKISELSFTELEDINFIAEESQISILVWEFKITISYFSEDKFFISFYEENADFSLETFNGWNIVLGYARGTRNKNGRDNLIARLEIDDVRWLNKAIETAFKNKR